MGHELHRLNKEAVSVSGVAQAAKGFGKKVLSKARGGMEAAEFGVRRGMAGVRDRVKGRAAAGVQGVGQNAVAGAKKELTPTFLAQAGENVATGIKRGLTPSRKQALGIGAGALALGGAAGAGLVHKGKQDRIKRKEDMQEAMSAAIQSQNNPAAQPAGGDYY